VTDESVLDDTLAKRRGQRGWDVQEVIKLPLDYN
jgi:hypothetical protein